MDSSSPSAAELQELLNTRVLSVRGRLSAIRDEFVPLTAISTNGTSSRARDSSVALERASVAGGAALLVGLALGLRVRRRRGRLAQQEETSIRRYVDHVLNEAAKLTKDGNSPVAAIEKALRRKPANVHVESPAEPDRSSVLASALGVVGRSAVTMLVEACTEWVMARAAASLKSAGRGDAPD